MKKAASQQKVPGHHQPWCRLPLGRSEKVKAVPPGFLQVASLGTPNGWALVGFGRLALVRDPASSVLGPFAALSLIALVTGGLAMARVRRMVTP